MNLSFNFELCWNLIYFILHVIANARPSLTCNLNVYMWRWCHNQEVVSSLTLHHLSIQSISLAFFLDTVMLVVTQKFLVKNTGVDVDVGYSSDIYIYLHIYIFKCVSLSAYGDEQL